MDDHHDGRGRLGLSGGVAPEIETVIRRRSECLRMSQATKVVIGTVGISAVLAAVLVVGILLG
jgi:hypothetical protein